MRLGLMVTANDRRRITSSYSEFPAAGWETGGLNPILDEHGTIRENCKVI